MLSIVSSGYGTTNPSVSSIGIFKVSAPCFKSSELICQVSINHAQQLHLGQTNSTTMQCLAIQDFKTGTRCGKPVSKNADGRAACSHHLRRALPGEKQCEGMQTKHSTLRCPNKARDDSDYCTRQHAKGFTYVEPMKFRVPPLRSMAHVPRSALKQQKHVDRYTGLELRDGCVTDPGSFHLDHIVECQVVATVVGKVKFMNDRERKKCFAALRTLTNDVSNLCMTAKWANMAKEDAVSRFLDDWSMKKGGPNRFEDYVKSAKEGNRQFDEMQVRLVCRAIEEALDTFSKALERESTDNIPEDVRIEFQKLIVAHKFDREGAKSPKRSTDTIKDEAKSGKTESMTRNTDAKAPAAARVTPFLTLGAHRRSKETKTIQSPTGKKKAPRQQDATATSTKKSSRQLRAPSIPNEAKIRSSTKRSQATSSA